ncbi:hypothetical protein OV450_1437 [Actinobacteria bacterium OV450]|nr:hypothetical protein OV450_1437 [Actinobacteria bacterium OV450]
MTSVRVGMVVVYATAYTGTVYCAAQAYDVGQGLSTGGLFAASVMLLAAIAREFQGAAAELTAGQPPATEPDCCEEWWTSLGHHHAPQCKALIRKDMP